MLETLSAIGGNIDLMREGLNKVSSDVPNFAKYLKPESISNFDEANEPLYIKTRNESLAGENHPETSVPFHEKIIQTNEGTYTGVFPEFPVEYEMKLDESLYHESDAKQFKAATLSLQDDINHNPDLKSTFTERQLEQINNGKVPEGYVWHHSEEPGVMQLVDRSLHENTAHTGGKSIWGGGSENR
ncbi:HNH endonuclease [Paenibacillus sp. NRS-1760]|uniref:HNH endonuclease n=1 Tax=Paenibacillus sp. NRS-1760 TaxID=3233902 RepID=UPI003D2C065F